MNGWILLIFLAWSFTAAPSSCVMFTKASRFLRWLLQRILHPILGSTTVVTSPGYVSFTTEAFNASMFAHGGSGGQLSTPLPIARSSLSTENIAILKRRSRHRQQLLRKWFDTGIVIVALVSCASTLALALNLWRTVAAAATAAVDTGSLLSATRASGATASEFMAPVIPGISVPWSEAPPVALAVLVAVVLHEIGHGLAAAAEGLKIDRVGFFVAAPFFAGGYVELPAQALERLHAWSRLRIWSAGVWHNVVLCVLIAFLRTQAMATAASIALFPAFSGVVPGTGTGVVVGSVRSGSPLASVGGLVAGNVIVAIGSQRVRSVADLQLALDGYIDGTTMRGFCASDRWIHSQGGRLDTCCDNADETQPCFAVLGGANATARHEFSCVPAGQLARLGRGTCGTGRGGWAATCGPGASCLIPERGSGPGRLPQGHEIVLLTVEGVRAPATVDPLAPVSELPGAKRGDATRRIAFSGRPAEIAAALAVTNLRPRAWTALLAGAVDAALEAVTAATVSPFVQGLGTAQLASSRHSAARRSITERSESNWSVRGRAFAARLTVHLANAIDRFFARITGVSAAIGVLNAVPVFALDGEYLLRCTFELAPWRRWLPARSINCTEKRFQKVLLGAGTILIVLNILPSLASAILLRSSGVAL
jgi:membrane-associated protease RseP (regulator of RpoE activity)